MTDKLFLSLLHCRRAAAETLTDRRDTLRIYNYQPPRLEQAGIGSSFLRLPPPRVAATADAATDAAGRYDTPLIGDDCCVTSPGGRGAEEAGEGEKERSRVIDWPIQMLMNGRRKRVRSSLVADWPWRPAPRGSLLDQSFDCHTRG